jgi:cytochrome c oxidase subunit II
MTTRRARLAVVVLAVALLASACSSQSPSTLRTAGDEAKRIAGVWWLMFFIAAGVYIVVASFVIYGSIRGRRKRIARGGGRSVKDDTFIWIGGLIVPIVILFIMGVVTVHTGAALRHNKPGELHVEVVGERWWWRVRYSDPKFETANEIHLPVNRPVEIGLDSDNVIHSFWVPQLAAKVDTIPGQHNVLRFTPEKIGVYRGLCAEFCGLQHAHMDFLVIVQSPVDFGRWTARRTGIAPEPASELAARGRMVFESQDCAGCHTIDGTAANGTVAPNLTDFGERSSIGAVTIDNTPSNLEKWITDPHQFKPGVLMPPAVMSHDDVVAIAAYLESLK